MNLSGALVVLTLLVISNLNESCRSVSRPELPRRINTNSEAKISENPAPEQDHPAPLINPNEPRASPPDQSGPPLEPAALPASEESPGCQVASKDTGLQNVTISVGSTRRTFIRVVNPNYNHLQKHAVVIGFHGAGLDGNSPRVDHKWPLVEQMAGDEAIFIYPNGLGGRWSASSTKSGDVLFFDEIVQTTSELFCIDKNRVFVHGFSNGAYFVNALVPLRASAIRGVISVAGAGYGAKVPAMIIHGIHDPDEKGGVNYYPNAPNTVSAYARANGCKVPINFDSLKLDQCQLMEACPAELPVWFCPWNGNHHWPEFTLPDVWAFISAFK
ncbi:MAG: hypothetical protein NTX25_17950 [Proteobacteria bacterium]|nr:hypothetical protein [Pseudomonadota bacterium]